MPELYEDERDLVVQHGLAMPRDDRATDGEVWRGRGLWRGELPEAIDLPARHRLGAPPHQDGTKVDRLHVVADLAQGLAGDRDLVAARDVGRGQPRCDVRGIPDDRVLH